MARKKNGRIQKARIIQFRDLPDCIQKEIMELARRKMLSVTPRGQIKARDGRRSISGRKLRKFIFLAERKLSGTFSIKKVIATESGGQQPVIQVINGISAS